MTIILVTPSVLTSKKTSVTPSWLASPATCGLTRQRLVATAVIFNTLSNVILLSCLLWYYWDSSNILQ